MKPKEEKKHILKTFNAKIKSIDEKNYIVEALISNETKDRDGEIILRTAWITGLADYLKHPILLSSHKYEKLTNQIGKAIDVRISDEGLVAKFQYFVGEGNAEADWAFNLASKEIAAYSVGFIGRDWIEGDWEKEIGRIFTDVLLLEVSQVLIPSNPDALQRDSKDPIEKHLVDMAIKAFNWGKKDLENPPAAMPPALEPQKPEDILDETMFCKLTEEHINQISNCMRVVMKEHLTDLQSCVKETILACFNTLPQKNAHYFRHLFNFKGPEPTGSKESIDTAVDQFVKKITESMKLK